MSVRMGAGEWGVMTPGVRDVPSSSMSTDGT